MRLAPKPPEKQKAETETRAEKKEEDVYDIRANGEQREEQGWIFQSTGSRHTAGSMAVLYASANAAVFCNIRVPSYLGAEDRVSGLQCVSGSRWQPVGGIQAFS